MKIENLDLSFPQIIVTAENDKGKWRLILIAHHPEHGQEMLRYQGDVFNSLEEAIASEACAHAIEVSKRMFPSHEVNYYQRKPPLWN